MTTTTVAQGSRSQLLFKKQTDMGSAATGDFSVMRINRHSLNPVIEQITPEEIRGDRHLIDMRQGNRSVRGQTTSDLVYGQHDDFIQAAMFRAFANPTSDDAGVILGVGTSARYYTMEDGALDIDTYRAFYDMIVSRCRFDFGTGRAAIARMTLDWVGLSGGDPANNTIGGTAQFSSSRSPFDTYSGALWDNAPETGNEMIEVTSLSVEIDNRARPIFGVGQKSAIAVEYGRGIVTGNMSMYYTQRSRQTIERFLRDIESVLVWNIVDPDGNTMEFRMNRVRFTGGDVPLSSEQSRVITVPYTAMYSSGQGYELKITKTGV